MSRERERVLGRERDRDWGREGRGRKRRRRTGDVEDSDPGRADKKKTRI